MFKIELAIDFSFWGYLRDKVYSHQPTSLVHLKVVIKEEVQKLPLQYYENICLQAVPHRLEECRKNNGQLIEPFL